MIHTNMYAAIKYKINTCQALLNACQATVNTQQIWEHCVAINIYSLHLNNCALLSFGKHVRCYTHVCSFIRLWYHRFGNFRCKNIFVVRVNHKNKENTKYIFIWIIIMVSTFGTWFLSTASLLFHARRPHLWYQWWLMANTLQLSAQCPINRPSLLPWYVPTATFASLLHACSSPTACGSYKCNKLFILLMCVISFQITKTKPENVEPI